MNVLDWLLDSCLGVVSHMGALMEVSIIDSFVDLVHEIKSSNSFGCLYLGGTQFLQEIWFE